MNQANQDREMMLRLMNNQGQNTQLVSNGALPVSLVSQTGLQPQLGDVQSGVPQLGGIQPGVQLSGMQSQLGNVPPGVQLLLAPNPSLNLSQASLPELAALLQQQRQQQLLMSTLYSQNPQLNQAAVPIDLLQRGLLQTTVPLSSVGQLPSLALGANSLQSNLSVTGSAVNSAKTSQDDSSYPFDSGIDRKQAFPWKLFRMLENVEKQNLQDVISFVAGGTAFVIFKPREFEKEIMPLYFSSNRLSSFQRQLNIYGFHRVLEGPHRGAYRHEYFRRGNTELLDHICRPKNIRRNRRKKAQASPSPEEKPENVASFKDEDEKSEDSGSK